MSWVVAVWDGPTPTSGQHARAILEGFEDDRDGERPLDGPSPRLVSYVKRLTGRWPDIGDEDGADSAWADGPLLGNVKGGLFLCALTPSGIEAGLAFMTEVAQELGLVCFDTQTDEVYVPAGLSAGSQEPTKQARRGWFRRR